MSREKLYALVGGLMLVVGLWVGVVPMHGAAGQNCGSVFSANQLTMDAKCEARQNSLLPVAIWFTAMGVIAVVVAAAELLVKAPSQPESDTTTT